MTSSIHQHDTHVIKKLLSVLILLLIIAIALSSYRYYAKDSLSNQIYTLTQQNNTLLKDNTALNAQREDLLKTLSEQQQTIAIQQATTTELQTQLNTLQDDIITLNQELDFYQNITSGQTTSKLHIKEFNLSAETALAGLYRYRLVLAQGKKITQPLTGTVKLSLNGRLAEETTTVDITEHAMRLRHIQVIHGLIQLQNDFAPETLTVKVTQNKKNTLNTTLDWNDLTQPVQTER